VTSHENAGQAPPGETGSQEASLTTVSVHAHPVTAQCPVGCLDGLLSRHTLNPLLSGLQGADGEVTVGDLAALYRLRRLGDLRGIGVGRVAEIEEVLLAAGLLEVSECYVLAASAFSADDEPHWVAAVDGPMIRALRDAHGFSQSLLARLAGLNPATVARLEGQAAPYCHRRTLDRISAMLGVPPASLERRRPATRAGEPRRAP